MPKAERRNKSASVTRNDKRGKVPTHARGGPTSVDNYAVFPHLRQGVPDELIFFGYGWYEIAVRVGARCSLCC